MVRWISYLGLLPLCPISQASALHPIYLSTLFCRRLLTLVYRNALSNAIKYGKKDFLSWVNPIYLSALFRVNPSHGRLFSVCCRRLLTLVYRNALSNAIKYGKKDGVVQTELLLEEHTLRIRVINEPGVANEELLLLEDPDSQVYM